LYATIVFESGAEMADATEPQQSTTRRRRGRPPGSKSKTRRRIGGSDLIHQLNTMVAELIKENRKLKRQVEKLTARGTKAASGTVERSLRTIQRRVQKALKDTTTRRRRRTTTAATTTRRRATTTKRRRKAG
jgi:septum formation inhibitor MinC